MKDTAILIQIENRVPTQMKEGFGLIYSETKSLQRLKTKTRDNLSIISRYVHRTTQFSNSFTKT